MKKFLGLLVFIVLLNGCDDGDVTVQTINFDDVNAASCNGGELIYKLKGNEALFMKIPAALNAFENIISAANTPKVFHIGGEIIVRYRAYSGTVAANNICPVEIPPISPIATIEWIATAGDIEVTTTAVYSDPDALTGRIKLEKYNHNIVIKNLRFATNNGIVLYDKFIFGDYTTLATPLPLGFLKENMKLCPSGTTLYNAADGGIEGIFIQNIDPALLSIVVLNTPKIGYISTTTNKLSYRLFTTALQTGTNESYFCGATLPATPAVNEEWLADDGAGATGIIEVTTTTNGPGSFLHTIKLKGVTFRKGTATFYFGNSITIGELITN